MCVCALLRWLAGRPLFAGQCRLQRKLLEGGPAPQEVLREEQHRVVRAGVDELRAGIVEELRDVVLEDVVLLLRGHV